MSYVAILDEAVEIWANTVHNKDKKLVNLPMVEIIREVYENLDVYITSTMKKVDILMECGVEIIILDATRHNHLARMILKKFFPAVQNKYPSQLIMADNSFIEEMFAAKIGFDFIGTTMGEYTSYKREEYK